jgi:NADH-quinone oxidoreductase subunit C
MTLALSGQEVSSLVAAKYPDAVIDAADQFLMIKGEHLVKVAEYLKNTPDLAFNYLADITAVDYFDYFEVVYRLTSLEKNRSLILKVRCGGRENPSVPSLTGLWMGANLMEREIYDLMGIVFPGHPNLKRIVLWEGFAGHPLRKDYL